MKCQTLLEFESESFMSALQWLRKLQMDKKNKDQNVSVLFCYEVNPKIDKKEMAKLNKELDNEEKQ